MRNKLLAISAAITATLGLLVYAGPLTMIITAGVIGILLADTLWVEISDKI